MIIFSIPIEDSHGFQATKEFIEKVNQKYKRKLGPISWSLAVRFLYARKFDVIRALTLFEQHEITRRREGLINFDPLKEPLCSELMTGKFTILVSFRKTKSQEFITVDIQLFSA